MAFLTFAAAPIAHAAAQQTVVLQPGSSNEMVEGSASYLITEAGAEIDLAEALAEYREGRFESERRSGGVSEFHDWRAWIALPFTNPAEPGTADLRRIIGIGGIFVEPPRVYLSCEGAAPVEILATQTGKDRPLSARYFTYLRSQSFTVGAGQSCLALINTASSDNPNIGIFREGELGTNQVVAVLLKGGFTATLLIIGLILAIVSYLTSRPLGVLIGIAYSVTMLQNEASLFTTTFVTSSLTARLWWEAATLLAIFAILYVFLFGFRKELRLENSVIRVAASAALMVPLIAIALYSNSTPDILWALYLGLFLFAITVALRFDIARPLRLAAGAILLASAIGALLVEPYYLGRDLSDLTIEFTRDTLRLLAGIGMLMLLLVDVLRSRRERNRMVAERIDALESQAQTDRRLLETEREYARARDAAARHKAQLAAASHDIRQPITGLRAAVGSEADRLSPALQSRLGEAIDYLEQLTNEYSDRDNRAGFANTETEAEPYSLTLVVKAVKDMFEAEAENAGIEFLVETDNCESRVPALALIRSTSNLVANAIRHAGAAKVMLKLSMDQDCRITVSDDGKGMDHATLQNVQQSGAKSEASEGEGLGLAIVHDLARRHGFKFEMESQPGEGTVGTITLPSG
ncbi:HAMP domain-containing sensor histidine kinase [uncultured Erythrobacter sp.]|uniref:sensor histidine kinase n=1 Tax=uncultured Erythrobacter sp. TaxID=263913 RepID=UPI002610C493|nr:HAMP domain-containing sensor histidine kinase [uncultured Erythrobacter sp.]